MNLVGNAVKFTFKGKIVVKVKQIIDLPNVLQITVKDTGIGMPD